MRTTHVLRGLTIAILLTGCASCSTPRALWDWATNVGEEVLDVPVVIVAGGNDITDAPLCADAVFAERGDLAPDAALGDLVTEGAAAIGRSGDARVCLLDYVQWCEVNFGHKINCGEIGERFHTLAIGES